MEFKIKEKDFYKITLIGCGGTGGYLAQSLSRIAFDSQKEISLTFIDGDQVEEKNVGRQNFYPADIGFNKAQVLAERYSFATGLEIRYVPEFVSSGSISNNLGSAIYQSDIIISAVDSAGARKNLHEILLRISQRYGFIGSGEEKGLLVWIDSGNGHSTGQILVGNSFEKEMVLLQKGEEISLLPYPSVIEPDLINEKKEKNSQPTALSCAERTLLREQSLTINQLMASVVSSITNNLLSQKGVKSYKVVINEDFPGVYPLFIEDYFKENKEKAKRKLKKETRKKEDNTPLMQI